MKNRVVRLSALCLLLGSVSLNAQEQIEKTEKLNEVVVTATKFAIDKEKIGKVIYQITAEELQNQKGKTVTDVLNNLAGVQIQGNNSSAGKNKSAYIRGGRGYQTIILIDGVVVNDPSGINNEFDLRLLTLSQIESIEVMNGAASTLYGSGAATGVINIKLKEAAKEAIALHFQTSVGTNNSQENRNSNLSDVNQNVAVNGTLSKFNYLVSANASSVSGLSEASDANSDIAFEKDKFQTVNTFVRLGYDISEKLEVKLFTNFDKDVFDYDAGAYNDSDVNNGINKQNRFGLSSGFKYDKGSLKLVASYNVNDRLLENYNSWTLGTDQFEYKGKSVYVDLVNDYKFSEKIQLITGVNFQDQNNQTNSPYGDIDDSLAKYNMIDPYATVVFNSASGFNINAGLRLNIHSEYGTHVVYNINPSFNFTNDFRLIASYSTAFITPSTYHLFSQYGNPDLSPEEDASIEAGFIYNMKEALSLNAVFFYREVENAIILPDYVQYQNAEGTINAKGVEAEMKIGAAKVVDFVLGYTYTYKSADLDYIPKNKFTAMVESTSIKNTYLSLQFSNISKRTYYDQWGTGDVLDLDAYSLLDFYGSYNIIKDKVSVFAQVNNIFNSDYVETIGYTTKGTNFRVGVDLNF